MRSEERSESTRDLSDGRLPVKNVEGRWEQVGEIPTLKWRMSSAGVLEKCVRRHLLTARKVISRDRSAKSNRTG